MLHVMPRGVVKASPRAGEERELKGSRISHKDGNGINIHKVNSRKKKSWYSARQSKTRVEVENYELGCRRVVVVGMGLQESEEQSKVSQ